jgi:hypothetical protein
MWILPAFITFYTNSASREREELQGFELIKVCSRDSKGGYKNTGWTPGVRFSESDREFSVLHSIQINSPLASYPGGTGTLSLGVNLQGRKADTLPPSSAEVSSCWTVPPLPIYLHDIVLHYIIKYRCNYTFYILVSTYINGDFFIQLMYTRNK